MRDGAQRWRQINSEHEEGADVKAQKRRAGDSAIWGFFEKTSFAAEVHRSHKRTESGFGDEKGRVGGFGGSLGHRRLGRCGWWCRAGRSLHAAHPGDEEELQEHEEDLFLEEERQHWCAVEVVYDLVEEVTKLCHRFKDR